MKAVLYMCLSSIWLYQKHCNGIYSQDTFTEIGFQYWWCLFKIGRNYKVGCSATLVWKVHYTHNVPICKEIVQGCAICWALDCWPLCICQKPSWRIFDAQNKLSGVEWTDFATRPTRSSHLLQVWTKQSKP